MQFNLNYATTMYDLNRNCESVCRTTYLSKLRLTYEAVTQHLNNSLYYAWSKLISLFVDV